MRPMCPSSLPLVLRGYGAKNVAEFFAVVTESFFERPVAMKWLMPDLCEELSYFPGFDPAAEPLFLRPDEDGQPSAE